MKRKSDNVSQARFSDTVESFYLEFTDKQIEALDYFLEENGVDWFSEKRTGVYELNDCFEDWALEYNLFPSGKIVAKMSYTMEYYSLAELLEEMED